MEPRLRKQFKEDCYFMTALGCSFSFDQAQINQIQTLVKKHGINKICVVANPNCSFIKNIITPKSLYNTKTEELLAKLYHKKYDDVQKETSFKDKCYKLSIIHSEFQVAQLTRRPELLSLIENYNLDISVMINHVSQKTHTKH